MRFIKLREMNTTWPKPHRLQIKKAEFEPDLLDFKDSLLNRWATHITVGDSHVTFEWRAGKLL